LTYKESKRIRIWSIPVLAAAVVYVLFYLQTPYLVFQPGSAESVKPMIKVAAGDEAEAGTFMLTTVRMLYASPFTLLKASLSPYSEFVRKRDYFGGQSRQEYNSRQQFNMMSSQSNAVEAAYRLADIPYEIRTESLIVLQVVPESPAAERLRPGDQIKRVDGLDIARAGNLAEVIQNKQVGETVSLEFVRGGDRKSAEIPIARLQSEQGQPYNGIGVVFANLMEVQSIDPKWNVDISAGDIGGPSAGLMFSLELYNRLTPGDLSKGYRIAGTGTITPEGKVGRIGGIRHKVVAAEREKADIFFAPKDNYADAAERAEQLGTDMKIVAVETLEEAIQYLDGLPPKQ
jgi:PDZ domain-containing protein